MRAGVILLALGGLIVAAWAATAPLWWDVDSSLMTPGRYLLAYSVYVGAVLIAAGIALVPRKGG